MIPSKTLRNVSRGERLVRIVGGLAATACGLAALPASAWGWGVAAVGAASLATGLLRYCPACDVAGRAPRGDR